MGGMWIVFVLNFPGDLLILRDHACEKYLELSMSLYIISWNSFVLPCRDGSGTIYWISQQSFNLFHDNQLQITQDENAFHMQ
jgi:hypothetical protein